MSHPSPTWQPLRYIYVTPVTHTPVLWHLQPLKMNHADITYLRNCAWALSNFCRGRPLVEYIKVIAPIRVPTTWFLLIPYSLVEYIEVFDSIRVPAMWFHTRLWYISRWLPPYAFLLCDSILACGTYRGDCFHTCYCSVIPYSLVILYQGDCFHMRSGYVILPMWSPYSLVEYIKVMDSMLVPAHTSFEQSVDPRV